MFCKKIEEKIKDERLSLMRTLCVNYRTLILFDAFIEFKPVKQCFCDGLRRCGKRSHFVTLQAHLSKCSDSNLSPKRDLNEELSRKSTRGM